jgi:7-cyano-7-deazaguanine synthase
VPWFKDFTKTALLGGGKIPTGSDIGIDDMKKSRATAKRVWVPNRNGILLNIAAGFAEGFGAKYVIPGFNREEGATFPDNTEEFLRTLDSSWAYSTASQVKSFCFSTKLTKTEIVKRGIGLDLPFELLWPCYFAKKKWCGTCESCQRYKRALEANGLSFEELRSAN